MNGFKPEDLQGFKAESSSKLLCRGHGEILLVDIRSDAFMP